MDNIKAIELNPKKMVKLVCNIEHAQIVLRADAYPTLIREGETCVVPEDCAYTIKNNKRKIRYGFAEVIQKVAPAAPSLGFPSVEEVQQTGDEDALQSTQLTEEEQAEALKAKRSAAAKKAAATRKANAETDDKKKD